MTARLRIAIFRYTEANILKGIRVSRKLSNKEVSKALGISPSQLSKRESGYCEVDDYSVITLLNHYNISFELFSKTTEYVYNLIVEDVIKEQEVKKFLNIQEYANAKIAKLDVVNIMSNIDKLI